MNMQFVGPNSKFNNKTTINYIRPFLIKPLPVVNNNGKIQNNSNIIIQNNVSNDNSEIPNSKKMKWGEPIWFFFHMLAEKAKIESFHIIRSELLNIIYSICSNLPCPKCTNHAIEYMKRINFNSIQTKNDLKLFLFQFHNEVNQRKNIQPFPYNQLDDKYSKTNTINIINYFFSVYTQNSDFNVTMISYKLQRGMIINKIKKWISDNIQYFDM
jgi:hypothetical protein